VRPVRVVAMSDTHGFHKGLEVPDGDILIHCGDADGSQRWGGGRGRRDGVHPFSHFARWFLRQPHKRKFFVEGNHEHYRQAAGLGKQLLSGSLECFGLHIHGLPYSRSQLGCREIPNNVDILVSHVPPYGILDEAVKPARADRPPGLEVASNHIGSKPLRNALAALGAGAPRLHLFGHIHEARGIQRSTDGTLFANVANANPGPAKCLQHGCMVFDVATDGSGHICIVKESSAGLKSPKPAWARPWS